MPVYTNVYSVEVGGRNVLGGQNFSTDRTGSVTSEVIVPGLDPGTYSVIMEVGEQEHLTIAIGEVEILAEGAIGAEVSAADGLADIGDSLVVVWHFNTVSKDWTFYDPRPAAAEFNTLSALTNGRGLPGVGERRRYGRGAQQQDSQPHLLWGQLLEPGRLVGQSRLH